ncbi:MAG TPA: AsmA-like C-terminal region-containing protein, partial [Terriglobales bacterium]|nr:AsmA-like C-terminal region-containing protein [Terriglobales bacterium]
DITPAQSQLEVGPFNVSLGRPSPLQVHALISSEAYKGSLRGDAGIRRLLQSAQMLGFPSPQVNADGGSTVDLTFAGSWADAHPKVLGTAQLHAVQAAVRGVNGPISVARANLVLSDNEVKVLNLNASAAGALWHGNMRIPRPCGAANDCRLQFDLHSPELSAVALNNNFNPASQKRSWYKFLSLGTEKPFFLLRTHASGKITVDKLLLGDAECSHFAAGLRLDAGRVTLSGLSGELLAGTISGDWEANFNSKPPEYKASGSLASVSLADVSELLHDGWIDGTGNLKYELMASGWSLRDLLDSAEVNTEFSVADSTFPHIVLTSTSGPLQAHVFSGTARLHRGEISFDGAKLNTAETVYTVSGTAALNGALNLRLSGDGVAGFLLSGTVLETRVSANPTTAASLKP